MSKETQELLRLAKQADGLARGLRELASRLSAEGGGQSVVPIFPESTDAVVARAIEKARAARAAKGKPASVKAEPVKKHPSREERHRLTIAAAQAAEAMRNAGMTWNEVLPVIKKSFPHRSWGSSGSVMWNLINLEAPKARKALGGR